MFTFGRPPGPARSDEWRPGEATAARRCWWHRFRWVGEDAFSASGLYACRCGVVRPGL